MRCALVIVSVMCFGQLIAQSTFYYSHITPYSNAPRSLVECEAGYLIAGESSLSGPHANGFLMLLDRQGAILWEKIIPAPQPDRYEDYRAAVYHQGYFYVAGYRWLDDKRRNLLLKVDPSNGNIVFDRIFGNEPVLGGDNLIQDMCVSESGILLACSGFNATSTDAELIQIDLEGNILWSRFYGADTNVESIDRMKRINAMNDGYLLTMNSLSAASWMLSHYIIKTDKQGNEIWRKDLTRYQSSSTGTDTLLWFYDVVTAKDDNIISLFVIDNMINNIYYSQSIVLAEFDKNGNEIDYIKYHDRPGIGSSGLFINEDSELFILASQELDAPLYGQLYAAKFNREKELLWEQHYGEENIAEIYFCGMLTSDGGVLIGGRDLNLTYVKFNSILVKTDCMGELEWSYENCVSPDLDEVVVFPNPFSDVINIHLPDDIQKGEVNIYIHNNMGQLIDKLTFFDTNVMQVNTSNYAMGFYNCTISLNGIVLANKKIIKVK